MRIRLALALLAAACGGCADFQAVSAFAQQTSKLTGVVRAELGQLDTLCREQAELTIVVADIADDGPLQGCRAHQAAQGRLAAVTIDVLDGYARALNGLADDKPFDLDAPLDAVGTRLQSLKDSGGNALLSAPEVTAVTKLAEVLAQVATDRRRETAVRRLVQERPDLAVTGRILRSYFVADPQAPSGPGQAPYATLAGLTAGALDSTQRMLQSKSFRDAEPIRSAELRRSMQDRKRQLARRTGPGAAVPAAIAAAIDAWLHALDAFTEEALRPEPRELLARLKDVRSKLGAARAALQSGGAE